MRPTVYGIELDAQSRCAHYRSPLDIVAIRMKCCGAYYACILCHEELAGHPSAVWPLEDFGEPAVLCGACDSEIDVRAYLASDDRCPSCGAAFNPGCRLHHHLYFA